ncbi:MAG: hypothetical protein M5R40_15875 [Anaerolineae bacterium]|nr:hypothetical protein [Anaerolineae bacterium]
MQCWHCERPAHATCRFCGRAVCREHVKELPFVLEIYRGRTGQPRALVVADAVWCGVCKPAEDPVDLPDLD